MIFNRIFAMPNSATFSIAPISALLDRYLLPGFLVVDPFAGNSGRAEVSNDLNPKSKAAKHMEAVDFLQHLLLTGTYDAVLFDPPYSPRQISEMYKRIGLKVGMEETQNGRLYKAVKDELHRLLRPGGIAICCGWNSAGFGCVRGYELLEILLVPHGGAHNDTIVTVERKPVLAAPPTAKSASAEGQHRFTPISTEPFQDCCELCGGDEKIECRSARWVVIRFPQQCVSVYHQKPANFASGTRMILERAKVEGRFGSCYTCKECVERAQKELSV